MISDKILDKSTLITAYWQASTLTKHYRISSNKRRTSGYLIYLQLMSNKASLRINLSEIRFIKIYEIFMFWIALLEKPKAVARRKFIGKHINRWLIFNKVASHVCNFIKNETTSLIFSSEFCEILSWISSSNFKSRTAHIRIISMHKKCISLHYLMFSSEFCKILSWISSSNFTSKTAHIRIISLHKKWSFPLRISLVNVTKSAVNFGFGHI